MKEWLEQSEKENDALRARVAELEKIEEKAAALFQACADLPLPEMDRMEKEINELSAALKGNA